MGACINKGIAGEILVLNLSSTIYTTGKPLEKTVVYVYSVLGELCACATCYCSVCIHT